MASADTALWRGGFDFAVGNFIPLTQSPYETRCGSIKRNLQHFFTYAELIFSGAFFTLFIES